MTPNADAARAGAGQLPGRIIYEGVPQAVYAGESLTQTMRQLRAYGRDGLPVLSADGRQVRGWITNQSVLENVAGQIGGSPPQDASATGQATPGRSEPTAPLHGYRVLDVSIGKGSPAAGRRMGSIGWPLGGTPVSVLRHRRLQEPDPDLTLADGDRVSLLVAAAQVVPQEQADAGHRSGGPAQRPARRPGASADY